MKSNQTLETYNVIAQKYKERNQSSFYTNEIRQLSGPISPNSTLLEAVRGSGRDALELMPICKKYTGIDGSEEMHEIARITAPDAIFHTGDFSDLNYEKNRFDAC